MSFRVKAFPITDTGDAIACARCFLPSNILFILLTLTHNIMKFRTLLFLLTLVSFYCLSQTREIYVNPAFNELTKDHKKLAILPFKTIIKLRPKQMEQMTEAQLAQLQKDE